MKDLQNKLDQHSTPDFDREALWQKIERPKRRRKFFFIWWFVGIGIIALGVWSWNQHRLTQQELDRFPILQKEKTGEAKDQHDPNQKRAEKQPTEELIAKKTSPLTDTRSNNFEQITPDHRITDGASDPTEQLQATPFIPTEKPVLGESNAPFLTKKETAPAAPPKVTEAVGLKPARNNGSLLSSLPSLPLTSVYYDRKPYRLPPVTDKKRSAGQVHQINLRFGASGQWHFLNPNTCNRIKEEQALPGYFLGLGYKRRFLKKHYVTANVVYSFHQSRINAQTTESETIINGIASRSLRETITTYELFNQYQRLDVAIGYGYSWTFRKYEVAVDGNFGIAHWLKIDGDFLDEDASLQSLPAADELQPAFFGQLNGEVSRTLPNGYRIGFLLSGQTPIKVSPGRDDCQHLVLPIYVGLQLGKTF
jgi:hypothetical protein